MDMHPSNRLTLRRAVALFLVMALILSIYAVRLFVVQIVEGEYYASLVNSNITLTLPVAASRGEILDRSMRPMAINRTSYEVIIDYNYFPYGKSAEKRQQQNEIILKLTKLLSKAGESWNDTLPISESAPYTFLPERESGVKALKNHLRMAEYATAENCMAELVKRYCLEAYSPADQRTIAGVQFEMELRQFGFTNPFTFSSDISKDTSFQIGENKSEFPGVSIQTAAVRDIVSGNVACHLIGTVGPMYAEDYAQLKDKGYALNDKLGKSGAEAAFEDRLRGKSGTRTLIKDPSGTVIESFESQAPVPGQSVVLTLDAKLQQITQQALADRIAQLRELPKQEGNYHDVTSGSAVMLDVRDGGVLVSASWPDYDLSTYQKNYNQLIQDPEKPLFNRALYGAFPCGSAMKPIVALAALSEGVIGRDSRVTCNGVYTYYAPSYKPRCLSHHGNINVITALSRSCNIFFYDVGRRLGIQKMNEHSKLVGLGQKTGIEIGEVSGTLAGPEHSRSIGQPWIPSLVVQAAIGQADNQFTPIQMAAYAMTIANNGVRYKTHLLHSFLSYDGVETRYQPEVLARAEWSQEAIQAVRDGMISVVQTGTARHSFKGVSYTVAGKTGTAQTGTNKSDNGLFICYAPVEKPEVAVAVVMENGGSRAAADVARIMLDSYFASKSTGFAPTPEGQLLP